MRSPSPLLQNAVSVISLSSLLNIITLANELLHTGNQDIQQSQLPATVERRDGTGWLRDDDDDVELPATGNRLLGEETRKY